MRPPVDQGDFNHLPPPHPALRATFPPVGGRLLGAYTLRMEATLSLICLATAGLFMVYR